MIVTTSICANYIPKARVLALSLKEHNPGAVFVLSLAEREIHPSAKETGVFDHVILADELGLENFESFMFRHSIVEASTAVKGHLFKELFSRFPEEDEFVYLDPDVLVTGEFAELREALKRHDIVLTPHLAVPEDDYEAILDNEICALKHGVFNLGFLAIRRSDKSAGFIDWWASRLYEFCYADIPSGLFTDQRWIDLAPCFFDVHSFRHPGYNIAPWNVSQRKVTAGKAGEYLVNGLPMRFFHFSGFDSGANEAMINKYCPDRRDPIYRLRDAYVKSCDSQGQEEMGKHPWSYGAYSNGEMIPDDHRLAYRLNMELWGKFTDPFDVHARPSFYEYVNRKGTDKIVATGMGLLLEHVKDAYKRGGPVFVIKKTLEYMGRK